MEAEWDNVPGGKRMEPEGHNVAQNWADAFAKTEGPETEWLIAFSGT